jgi:hypothetical protein
MAVKKSKKTIIVAPTVHSADLAANGYKPLTPKEILQRKCLTSEDVMEVLKISRTTLSNYCTDKLLICSKLDKRLYFDLDDIITSLENGKKHSMTKKK